MPADLLAHLTALHRLTPICAEEAMARTTRWMADHAKTHHPFQNRTGDLEASIAAGVLEVTATHVVGALSAGSPDHGTSDQYAGFVELGTSRSAPYPFIWPAMLEAQRQHLLIDFFRA